MLFCNTLVSNTLAKYTLAKFTPGQIYLGHRIADFSPFVAELCSSGNG